MKTHKIKREMLTRKETANRLGISVRTFDRWRKKLGIAGERDAATGYWVRFDWDDVKKYQR